MPLLKKAYGDYSVGWICALPKEQTAATSMLDEKHEDLPKLTNDANTYTLGSIGPHNVVIACLPMGQYGTNSAANVASFMIRTFPSIKIGLMVGIGGGVPPKVRLGDVVISTPTGQFPGVVQWDFGKATEGGNFERTGALSNPPGSLLTALGKLETEYELTGSKIPRFLEELKAKFPRLAKKYLKSDKLQDLLFQADYAHVKAPFLNMNTEGPTGGIVEGFVEEDFEDTSDEDGDPCQFCDKSKLVKKRLRSIRVHHGLIASGNKVIKDGLLREKLNSALGGDVLCFETEAAGLMNNFPCLVVRGICDYCDSHKNDAWQEHAAAVAAAFAKELLGCIQPRDFEGERLIGDVMSEVKQGVERLNDAFAATKEHLDAFRVDAEAKKQTTTLNWLSSLDLPLIQHDYFARCEPNTGQEFLISEQVQNWISTSRETLYCEGVPGAGKTFQMAILVNHLIEKFRYDGTVGVAYIYYNYKRHQDQKAEHMLASLVKQLARNSRVFPEVVQELHSRHSLVNTRPFLGELSDTLAVLVRSLSRAYILIDALDEAEDSERTKFLEQIFMMQENSGLNLFATSRAINTVAAKFEGSLSREISPSRHDVFQVLNARMSELPSFVKDDEALQDEIKSSIEAAMGGMFLLAQLYLNSLAGSRSLASLKKSLSSLQEASSLPSSDRSSVLDEAYDKSMERIQQLKGDLPRDAVLIISWIVKARRQMKVAELREALAVEIGRPELDVNNIPRADHITQACASLVVIEGDSIELVHYTAQEYFERPNNRWMQQAHLYIANICLTYLSLSTFRNDPCLLKEDYAKRIQDQPFYGYSNENWAYHTNEALDQGLGVSDVIGFLEYGETQESWYQNLLCGHVPYISEPFPTQLAPLHVASFFGLHAVVADLLGQGINPRMKDSESHLPITWAAFGGSTLVVQLLLGFASVGTTDELRYDDCKPLMIAAIMGHEAVVELLLDKYDIESNDEGWTPLNLAAQAQKRAVFDLLIQRGADMETRDNEFGQTPLAIGAKDGRLTTVQWLIEKGADIEATDEDNRTPLALATMENQEDTVHYLVEKGANVEARDNDQHTPLVLAIVGDHGNLVQYFIERGSDMEAEDSDNRTPLMLATMGNHENLVRYLVAKGANIQAIDKHDQTPFTVAVQQELTGIVDFFLRFEVNINTAIHNKHTPLTLAINIGADNMAEWLVQGGADLNKHDEHGMTPLLTAVERGNSHIVQFLIEAGASLELPDHSQSLTPLLFATEEKKKEIVELLIDKGADMEARGGWDCRTALISATQSGDTDIIQSLLEKGANIEARDFFAETPLIRASKSEKKENVELLIRNNANLEAKDYRGSTPLSMAVRYSGTGTVQLLLDRNASVEAEDRTGRTPLVHAAEGSRYAITELLLKRGAKSDYRDDSGRTLVHMAVEVNALAYVSLFLQFDAVNVDEGDNKGRTPLSYAAERGYNAITKALLQSTKVNANAQDHRRYRPLRYAMDREDASSLKVLLESEKVEVNAYDLRGRTPLLYAIENRKGCIIKALLDCERVNAAKQDDQGRTSMQYAIDHKDDNMLILSMLLQLDKMDVNMRDRQGRTPLLYAIESKEESVIKLLLSCERVDANEKDDQGRTAIQYAIDHGDEDRSCLMALLNSGNLEFDAEEDGFLLLTCAVERGDKWTIQALLRSGKVDVNARDNRGRTPLFRAVEVEDTAILETLLDSGEIDVNAKDNNGRTPLFYAMVAGDVSIVEMLISSGKADANARDNEGLTPLQLAMDSGETSSVRMLLEGGKVDINAKDDRNCTPLQYAIQLGSTSATRVLLEYAKEEEANAKDDKERTPLQYAIELGKIYIVKTLVGSRKVDLNMKGDQERTPIHYAVECRNDLIVKMLLGHTTLVRSRFGLRTINTNATDNEGRTPLLCAMQKGDEPIVHMLLSSGKVDVNIADNKGRTPLSYAMELVGTTIVKALVALPGINLDTQDHQGRTPLSYAASHEVARVLLKTGKVDVNSKDHEGRTPLWYAARAGNQELAGLLRRRGAKDRFDTRSKTPSSQRSQGKGSRSRRIKI